MLEEMVYTKQTKWHYVCVHQLKDVNAFNLHLSSCVCTSEFPRSFFMLTWPWDLRIGHLMHLADEGEYTGFRINLFHFSRNRSTGSVVSSVFLCVKSSPFFFK